MKWIFFRIAAALVAAAMVLGFVLRPPANLTQGLGMLLPVVMLAGVALRGPRRSILPRKRPR
jgi:hypothetical protein